MDLYIAALTKWEGPDEYQNLLQRLAESYQPVGAAEELGSTANRGVLVEACTCVEIRKCGDCLSTLHKAYRREYLRCPFTNA